jgi:hypothetical protein
MSKFDVLQEHTGRNLCSPLDEMVFHWTILATQEQCDAVGKCAVNSASFPFQYIATLWRHQLDLLACSVATSEYFADDNQANIDEETSSSEWKARLKKIIKAFDDMHYMERQMSHF